MKKLIMTAAAVLPLLGAFGMGAAQQMPVGKWTGTVTPPNESAVEVTYDVAMKGDTIAITIVAGEHGSFAVNEVRLNERALTFWFTPGPRVDCSLARRDDGAYEGTCTEAGSAETAHILMVPPKKQ